MSTITLTPWEMLLAAQAGIMRQVENLKKGRKPYYGAGTDNDWQLHVEGCLGEFAFAKYLGVFWNGKGRFRDFDVGNFDVRTGKSDISDLILHPKDPDDRIFWLICGRNGVYSVKGYISGKDGKKQEYWKDPLGGRPAYFVPQKALKKPTKED